MIFITRSLVFGLWSLFRFLVPGTWKVNRQTTPNSTTKTYDQRPSCLWKYPAHTGGFRHAIDCQNVRAGAHISVVTLSGCKNRVECRAHRLLQSVIDLVFRPEERVLILNPFIVA